jgi:hypothetical protein
VRHKSNNIDNISNTDVSSNNISKKHRR